MPHLDLNVSKVPTTFPSSPAQETRVMIVDDHPIVRAGLSMLINSQPDLTVCGEAANLAEAVNVVQACRPEIAVVDIALKNECGLDVVRRITLMNRSLRVLVLSMYDDALYAERALDAGAMGYLNKQASSGNVLVAIRRLIAGQRYLSDAMARRIEASPAQGAPASNRRGVQSLTDRELEVFRLIGTGLTTVEIAERLFLSVKTIETHRLKIKSKLQLRNSAELSREATHFVLRNG